MKKKTLRRPTSSEVDIRAYAYHLYEQSGRIAGRDLDHWLEAKASLDAHIPPHQSHRRLHTHVESFTVPNPDAKSLGM